ncbi:MAG: MFS transporter [Clostridiales bacterium]|jgi:GPH family glycoside/pentoside/hexuronide:cation symporter/probable glucitol transport protein GutA|nr:MFS transporter [Clostridiales bacterium]
MANSTKKFLSAKEVAAYSLGLFGFQLIFGYLNSYQAEFYMTAMGANLAVVGMLILVVKIVSAVFDPIVGNLIEKKGKLKPFILLSTPLLFITAVWVFIDVPLSGAWLYIYIFFTFLLFSMSASLGDIPSQAIASVVTPDPTERTNLISLSGIFKAAGLTAAATVVPIVCLIVPGGSQFITQNNEPDTPMSVGEFTISALVIALVGCALFLLIYFLNKERVPYYAEKTNFRDMIGSLKNNKPFMLVIISCFLGFGRQIQTGIGIQAANTLLDSQSLAFLIGLPTAIGALISMAMTPALIKKIGEKKTYIGVSVYGFAASMISFFVGYNNFWVMMIFLFLTGLQFGVVNIMPLVMTADTVDYYEYKTGKRAEGTFYAVLSLTIKVTLALGTALGLILVSVSKYNTELLMQAPATKDLIYFAYIAAPGIFSLLSIFPILKYDIFGKRKAEIAEELQKIRETAKPAKE